MPASPEINRAIAAEWRDLGFFYEIIDSENVWRFAGSRQGLAKLPNILREYISNPKNAAVSEHDHYGPYWYLKIVTSPEALITANSIRGSLVELSNLADIIEAKIVRAASGETVFAGVEFSPQSTFALRFELMDDDFDPASADPLIQ